MNKQIITGVVALIIGVGIGYLGAGMLAPAAKTGAGAYAARTGTAGTFARSGAAGAGLLSGTVAAEDSSSITLDTKDGSSHVVLVSPSTTVQKSTSGTMSDVTTGSTVVVMGTTNADGSVSATSIQLRPAMAAPMMPATSGQ
jgi:hypothetical protein